MPLKMTPKHLSELGAALRQHDTNAARAAYRTCSTSSKGYRWYLVRKAGMMNWLCSDLYAYLNDTHIDNALKSLVPDLQENLP